MIEKPNYKEEKGYSDVDRGHVRRQIFVSGVANLLQLMQGCALPISSFILPQIQESKSGFSVTKEQGSWFASMYCIGYLSGSVAGGIQSEFVGRRISLIIDSFLAIIGFGIISFTRSFPLLLLGRFLGGHSCGCGTVSIPIYSSEISHPDIRGMTGSFVAIFFYFGVCASTILGTLMPWRIAIGMVILVPVTAIILLYFCPESPHWLLRHGYEEDAMKSLTYFQGSVNKAEKEKQRILLHLSQQNKEEENSIEFFEKLKSKIRRFSSPAFWKPLTILIMMLPVFFEWSGLPMISFYLVSFLQRMRIPMDPYYGASAISMIRLVCAFISMIFLLKFKRRVIYFTCISFMIAGCVIITTHDYLLTKNYLKAWGIEDNEIVKWIPAIGMLLFYNVNSLGLAQITNMTQGEIFPADMRSIGSGIIGIVDGLSLFAYVKIGPILLENYGLYAHFGFTALILCAATIFVYLFLPETHGKTLEDIENYFLEEKNKTKRLEEFLDPEIRK